MTLLESKKKKKMKKKNIYSNIFTFVSKVYYLKNIQLNNYQTYYKWKSIIKY